MPLKNYVFFSIALTLISLTGFGQAQFIPNMGQWEGDFVFKCNLNQGALFFEKTGYTAYLLESNPESHDHDHSEHHHHGEDPSLRKKVAYQMRWNNTQAKHSQHIGKQAASIYHNYFLGNNPDNWKSKVPLFNLLEVKEVYPGVQVNYYSQDDFLKYDIVVNNLKSLPKIEMTYHGLKSATVQNGRLVLNTGLGEVYEWIPLAYQLINGQKIPVACNYEVRKKSIGFSFGTYAPNIPIVIDPILDFATYSGSTIINFGYTATYDNQGHSYGGGITYGMGYPTSLGVVQGGMGGGGYDISITKFSKHGDSALYATYLGGTQEEAPHSMVVNSQGELHILGNTGSNDFPVLSNAYQSIYSNGPALKTHINTYANGSNIFICKLSSDGTAFLGCTYLGGDLGDGINLRSALNYGDNNRGEIALLDQGKIAIFSSSLSTNLPLNAGNVNHNDSTQNAILVTFNSNLSQLLWGTYVGGNGNETGYSMKYDGSKIIVCGSTRSSNLFTHSAAWQAVHGGSYDGFIATFNAASGAALKGTYIGDSGITQAFFIDKDKLGNIYVVGQSDDSLAISNGKYANPGSRQFIQKYDSQLNSLLWSTQVGSGQNKYDLVPSAFMVDNCLNIYLSGWNGAANQLAKQNQRGNTKGLPTSADAFDSTSNGDDFYFMVLDPDAQGLKFASYFGGSSEEHVDGGTSRFSPDGIMYQAVCAGCSSGSFPTTPGSYSPTKPTGNCNLGLIKIDFNFTVRSVPIIDYSLNVDTVCDSLIVTFTNHSLRSQNYQWFFGDGTTSTDFEPVHSFAAGQRYQVTLVATDTFCGISDTSYTTLFNPKTPTNSTLAANFIGCSKDFKADFDAQSDLAHLYHWNFGDGQQGQGKSIQHTYPSNGVYTVELFATDTICNRIDTLTTIVEFNDTSKIPNTHIEVTQCKQNPFSITHQNERARFSYRWIINGLTYLGPYPSIHNSVLGTNSIQLTITDSLCSSVYDKSFNIYIEDLFQQTFIPNAFTPNADELNEQFMVVGNDCDDFAHFAIFNRWGQLVFETNNPYQDFWDGTFDGEAAKEDVYLYRLKTSSEELKGKVVLIR